MKLISCHVENFGALSNVDYTFNDGLTAIIKENGAGKTTLASFIKAIFYGLPQVKSTSMFNDREKFYPFSGGKFGGTITFEAQGKNYKVERFFDKKSPVKDTLKVYEDLREVELGDEPGKYIFGLDEKSFSRTVFFGSDGVDLSEGTGVKLADFIENTDNGEGFDSACVALTEAKKRYKAFRGDAGIIKECREKKRAAEIKVESLENLEKSVVKAYAEKKLCEENIAKLNARYEAAVNAETLKAKRANLDRLTFEIKDNKIKLDEFRKKYPNGIPSSNEIARVSVNLTELSAKKIAVEKEILTPEEQEELTSLENEFDGDGFSDGELSDIRRRVEAAARKNTLIKRLDDEISEYSKDEIVVKFDNNPIEEAEITDVMNDVEEYRVAEEKRKILSERGVTANVSVKRKSPIKAIMAIIGVLALLGGVGLAYFNYFTAGVGVAVFGAVILLISFFVGKQNGTLNETEREYADIIAKCNLLRESVSEYTAKYGYYSRDGILVSYSRLCADLDRYAELSCERQKKIEYRNTLEGEYDKEVAELLKLFRSYGITETLLGEAAERLAEKCRRLRTLKETRITKKRNFERLKSEIAEIESFMGQFITAYKLFGKDPATFVSEMADDRAEKESLERRNIALEKEIENYKSLAEKEIVADTLDKESLYDEIKLMNNRLASIKSNISLDEAALEELPDARSALDEATEELAVSEEKYEVIGYALEFLEKAERKLMDEYVTPVKDAFVKYASVIERTLGESVEMNKDFAVSFERNGELRGEKHFSTGQRAVIDLCLRLAVADNVFKGEKPFVILDDPFVALDEERFENVSKVIKELTANRQIIYFTCHNSRTI